MLFLVSGYDRDRCTMLFGDKLGPGAGSSERHRAVVNRGRRPRPPSQHFSPHMKRGTKRPPVCETTPVILMRRQALRQALGALEQVRGAAQLSVAGAAAAQQQDIFLSRGLARRRTLNHCSNCRRPRCRPAAKTLPLPAHCCSCPCALDPSGGCQPVLRTRPHRQAHPEPNDRCACAAPCGTRLLLPLRLVPLASQFQPFISTTFCHWMQPRDSLCRPNMQPPATFEPPPPLALTPQLI